MIPNYQLTKSELTELFQYTKMERKFKKGLITRDNLTTYRFTLSKPVQDTIIRNSKITFEIID
jgi:hypothetical protein